MGNDYGEDVTIFHVVAFSRRPSMANRAVCLDLPTVGNGHYRSAPRSVSVSPYSSGVGPVDTTEPMPPGAHLPDVDNGQLGYVE